MFKKFPTLFSILGTLLVASPASNAAEVAAVFNTPADVPVTAASFVAAGNTVAITLNHAPAYGANLTVVNSTSAAPIEGAFGNLPDGETVTLNHAGIAYGFVANYHGGNGNDLVLQWQNSRLMGWGYNGDGQLGHGPGLDSSIVVLAPSAPAVFAGKTVIAAAAGGYVGLASCSDGTLAAWGRADQTASPGPQEEGIPYLVDTSGALAGKKVVGMSAGFAHVLVLCSDGTMVTWGNNPSYEFGSGVPEKFPLPVAVPATGALAGKTVIAISSGTFYNLALCSDGKVVGWGRNGSGQLGNGGFDSATAPVAVNTSGLLNGKTVVSIATGRDHALALCSDGTLVAWGGNGAGQLGNNSITTSNLPVAVSRAGLLAGKTITAISAGANHSMALCSDGTLATWGDNGSGQLGTNNTTASRVPVSVIRTGVLSGKTVTGIVGGQNHSLACCSDGTAVAWGYNAQRQLGTITSGSQNLVPVLVGRTSLRAGERFVRMIGGPLSSSSFAITGSAPLPVATPLDATLVADNAATLNGTVNANGTSTSITFEYGTTSSYGTSVAATPASASGSGETAVNRRITGLLPGLTYHYRIVCTGAAGTVASAGKTFTTTSQAALAGLTLSKGTLDPAFAGNIASYNSTVPFEAATITVTPVVATPGATVRVNGARVDSGSASGPIALATGNNTITAVATSPDGATTKSYTVTVIRLPQTFAFASAGTIPLTANGFFADGEAPPVQLLFSPPVGTSLTLVRNTGTLPISGSFTNLTHGRIVDAAYGGTTYRFVANYFGGSGNDLVLQWANTQLVSWGSNIEGQLGDGTKVLRRLPVAVDSSGPLAGRSVIALSAGISHSLALCSDGKMLAWGTGSSGVLGTGVGVGPSSTPIEVDTSGLLAGKTVSSISAGFNFNHALCSDGTLVAWGDNRYGQIGDGTEDVNRFSPVAVDTSGVLTGKRVVAVSGGSSYALALCSDGTVVSWGANFYGELGVTPQKSYRSPVAVDRTGVLAGKTVVAISAGGFHALALCSDGTLASWGWNDAGQLGNNTTANSLVPVAVNRSGVLAGKTIIEISASDNHSLVLCSDGTLAAWGANYSGQLGDNSTTNRRLPVAVNRAGLLAGKTVTRISTARSHSLALCSDGTLAAWGSNSDGQLGTGTTASSPVPVAVKTPPLGTGTRFVAGNTGPPASHSLGLLALPMPASSTLAATSVTGTSATLRGDATANGSTTHVSFEYGPTESYGMTVLGNPASFGPTAKGQVSAAIQGLTPGTIYYYRIRAESASGTTFGSRMSFTTLNDNTYLQNLGTRRTTMAPAFDKTITRYITTLPHSTDSISVTAISEDSQASVTVGGIAAGQGGGTVSVNVPVGSMNIPVVVTAEDGVTTRSYLLVATRLPDIFTFNSATDVPVTADQFLATGQTANFALNFHPGAGTRLTVVNNLSLDFIIGTFGNLAQGQELIMTYQGTGYRFVADYFGDSGNDLVLHWADNTAFAWGFNSYGQLGSGSGEPVSAVPVEIGQGSLLKGKTILALSTGYLHSLALCSDGSLAAWGYNVYGQLGNGGTTVSGLPVAVDRSGALAGRTVIAISAGPFHNLALCSDGGVVAWGYNNYGQLGDGTRTTSPVPVSVQRIGALAGKTVIAVAAGAYHSLALCSDGAIAAWGFNDEGELGNGGTIGSLQPVAVGGALTGKTVVSMAAGQYHAIALCTDGTVAAWGYNHYGQLGTGGTTFSPLPVQIGGSGALSGRKVSAVSASGSHSLAICTDGTLAAWGLNSSGQLGDGTTSNRLVPVIVDKSGILAGKSVTAIAAGIEHSLATCADGTLAAWGSNRYGRLGNPGPASSSVPVGVSRAAFPDGAIPVLGTTGSSSSHGFALVALPHAAPVPLGLTETTAQTVGPDGLETWRLTHFGQSGSEGDSSDFADPDHDGIVNLIEYAFALDPKQAGSGQLPQWQRIGNELVISFTEPPGVSGITYGAKTSTALDGADWLPIKDSGTAPQHVFRVPIDRASRFVRLEVTSGKVD
jgi:alpha-tubulin suppressor-like RCC1 family protein